MSFAFNSPVAWRTISSAPMDGTPIIACVFEFTNHAGGWPTTVRWELLDDELPKKGHWRDCHGSIVPWITHWVPMPTEPV